ncbi:hypothetical protein CY0110_17182 [Crocosphaera chwakensis CCY0110]|uniref:Uncharacterized protein n=1 Tax=Crocosphaera chwakensis CCY0110 TaxID=391612 RepID=A3IIB8_9CHRO|nr:hypothetical protein CY0110_17182 [Crocosphaera chwakensis CCY0110]
MKHGINKRQEAGGRRQELSVPHSLRETLYNKQKT